MNEEITRWLPLLVALLTGIIALSQVRSNNITNARIKWLENLKQVLVDFMSESTIFQLKEGVSRGIQNSNQDARNDVKVQGHLDRINDSIYEHLKIIESKHNLIRLNLNPKEDLHKKLETFLDKYMDLFNKIPTQENLENYKHLIREMSAYSETIILLIRYVMKLEWEKTKRSNLSRIYYMKFGKGKEILIEALNLKLLPIKKAEV